MNPRSSEKHLPGESGVWVFILGDMIVFSLFFCVYLYYRGLNVPVFLDGQAQLNQTFGMLNTLLLLGSSLLVALAVERVRTGDSIRAPRLFLGALACGIGFCLIKVFEYGEKIRAGISITSNDFFMYYYVFTGVHWVHLLIGMGLLIALSKLSKKAALQASDLVFIESGATYWHLVDLLWIVLFPLLYLVK